MTIYRSGMPDDPIDRSSETTTSSANMRRAHRLQLHSRLQQPIRVGLTVFGSQQRHHQQHRVKGTHGTHAWRGHGARLLWLSEKDWKKEPQWTNHGSLIAIFPLGTVAQLDARVPTMMSWFALNGVHKPRTKHDQANNRTVS